MRDFIDGWGLLMRPRGLRRFVITGILYSAALWISSAAMGQQQDRTQWKDYGGGYDNSHYVTLKQINKSNVKDLQVAWTYPSRDGQGHLQNPLVIDGIAYVVARGSSLVALDATNGKEIWVHEKLTGLEGRGLNYWESKDRKDRRFVFQLHGQLQEIDAQTGKSILTFGDNGFVDLRVGIDRNPETIGNTGPNTPGKVFEDLVIIGASTGDSYMSPHGDIRAYDVLSGKLVWQFHTLPRPGDPGYDTWAKDSYKYISSTTTWGELSVDAKRGIVYLPTSEPGYGFYGLSRPGQNLYANCIVALDARTGKYLWHFQEVHHDLWDYDAVSAPQLLTIQHDGKSLDVVAHAGKTGFLYVLDRVTGKPIWPIEERPVPKSTVPGEVSWPTQPFPTVPPPFARQSMRPDEVNPYLPADLKAQAQERVANADKTFQGIFTPPGLTDTMSVPGNRGGSNWGTTASNPSKGIMYVLSADAPSILKLAPVHAASGGSGEIARIGLPSDPKGTGTYQQICAACHGADMGGSGDAPSLVNVSNRLSTDEITGILKNGRNRMPALGLTDAQIADVLSYLTDKGSPFGGRGRGGRGGAEVAGLGGPVVQSGGAPAGEAADAARTPAPPRGGLMDNGPYPPDVTQYQRYYTGWNVLYDLIAPPWNSLTAYDLNKGTIMWQVPVGNPPGVMLEQRGILSTSGGLIFVATGDGAVKAYDDETGDVLWTGTLPGGNRSIPTVYEAKGREYLLISATQPIEPTPGTTPAADTAPEDPLTSPKGYVAFALPQKTE
jgi:quinoprotein glucose dehydrogenase